MSIDFDVVEEELGVDLPAEYRDFMDAYEEAAWAEEPLGYIVVSDTKPLLELNERIVGKTISGLEEWPSEYVLFGDDGCGNFYAIDLNSEATRVLFYDHESDELTVDAESLADFGRSLAASTDEQLGEAGQSTREVVSSGYEVRRKKAVQAPRLVESLPSEAFTENWQTDWSSFVSEVLSELGRSADEEEVTAALNARFGNRPVWWTGVVEKVDLGEYKSVFIEMPSCDELPGWSDFSWGPIHPDLRTEEEDWHDAKDPSKQILTSLAAWKAVSPGDTIRFQMMIAPGYEDRISCISRDRYGSDHPPHINIQNCGGHVTEVLPSA